MSGDNYLDARCMSPGEQLLDLVHIDDVTCAFSLCTQRLLLDQVQQPHERYAVSSGRPLSMRQLVALLEQLSGKRLNVTFGARPYRTREVMRPPRVGAKLLGWEPQVGLQDGLKPLLHPSAHTAHSASSPRTAL